MRRDDPHLDEAHRLRLAVVALRVLHPRAERRALDGTRREDPAVAAAVGVLERPFGDVCDALDVAVWVHRPDGARDQAVVVEDAEVAEPRVRRVHVVVEAEVPVRAEPAPLDVMERIRLADRDHGPTSGFWIGSHQSQ